MNVSQTPWKINVASFWIWLLLQVPYLINISTRNPSIPEDKIDWPKFTTEDPAYLEITLDPTVKRGIKTRRTDFWNDYIPKLRKLLKAQEAQPTESSSGKAKDEL